MCVCVWFALERSLNELVRERDMEVATKTHHNRIGYVRVGCVWFVAINGVDAPKDGQSDGRELNGRLIVWLGGGC